MVLPVPFIDEITKFRGESLDESKSKKNLRVNFKVRG